MKSALRLGVSTKSYPFSSLIKKNTLEKTAVAVLQNAKITELVEQNKWQEAMIVLEQSKLLNHAVNNTTLFLESLIYRIGFDRSDKAEETLNLIKNKDVIFYNQIRSMLDVLYKTKDTLYKVEPKDIKRLIQMTQDIEIQRFKSF